MIPYTLNDTGISFFLKGQKNFRKDYPQFEELKNAVISGDVAAVEKLANPKTYITKMTQGNVVITTNDEVMVKGIEVPDFLAARILDHIKQNIPIAPLCAFAEKLMQNPNVDVRGDLYKWLDVGKMPIYPDGDFLAYKKVRADYTPIHQGGKYGQNQSVGMVVEQPRETCNENRDHTCSSGLHFCSHDYLGNFGYGGDNRVIVLKINPRDVVSIPTDYNLTKGRTCRFEVVDEITPEDIKAVFNNKLVVSSNKPVESTDNSNKRDEADKALLEAGGNKTQAAASLGISRSTLNRWLAYEKQSFEVHDHQEVEEDWGEYIDDSWDDDSWDEDYMEVEETDQDVEPTNKERAEAAILATGGNKTQAAEYLGIARSTLNRWLNS